jgi:hypothetical protein
MNYGAAKMKGILYVAWHAKHMVFHVLIALLWAWVLRERWQEFNVSWIIIAVIGGLLPDIDHLIYFFTYGKNDPYTRSVMTFFKKGEWRVLTTYLEHEHKHNTNLTFHNYYTAIALVVVSLLSSQYDWRTGVILFGSMVTHYAFDIIEDILLLGHVNPNWKRWGRP